MGQTGKDIQKFSGCIDYEGIRRASLGRSSEEKDGSIDDWIDSKSICLLYTSIAFFIKTTKQTNKQRISNLFQSKNHSSRWNSLDKDYITRLKA